MLFRRLVLSLVVGLLCSSVMAQTDTPAPIVRLTGAWARPTAVKAAAMSGMDMTATQEAMSGMDMGADTSAAYLNVENLSDAPITLMAVQTQAADMAQVHEVVMENDVATMQELADGLVIPAGETVALAPGGYHIMMMGITKPLYLGDAISLTFTFKQADDTSFDQVVGALVSEDVPEVSPILVTDAWARPTVVKETAMSGMNMSATQEAMPMATPDVMPMGAMDVVSAAYMQITNQSDTAERLISVTSDAAAMIQIHEIVMENDVAKMQELTAGLDLPVGETVLLQPGGYHMMIMKLAHDFVPGEAVVLTLHFESGRTQQVAVPIYTPDMP